MLYKFLIATLICLGLVAANINPSVTFFAKAFYGICLICFATKLCKELVVSPDKEKVKA